MRSLLAAFARVALLAALATPALAQDPEPPTVDRYAVDLTIGSMPFTPGQTLTFSVPSTVPGTATEVLVLAEFTCSLITGQIQYGMLVNWTIWTPVIHYDQSPGEASFQSVMWCAPGQLMTSQVMGWLPISAASRNVFVQLNTTGNIPWDNTQSTIKIVSYMD